MEREHLDPYVPREHSETITRPTHELPIQLSPDFIRVYGSQTTIASTHWDVSFTIAQPVADTPQEMYIEQRALITMSWQAAKIFAQSLTTAINAYEQHYGEIPVPRSEKSPLKLPT